MECDSSTGTRRAVKHFAEYVAIGSKGEADLSEDCDHLVLCGDNKEVFTYEISTGKKSLALAVGPFDALYITPNNNVIISWGIAGTSFHTGVALYDRNMVFQRQLTSYVGHKAVGRDADGSEIMVITDNNDNAVKKVRLSDGKVTTILPPLDWSLACHISCPAQSGFCIVSTYGKNRAGEILQVPLDGSQAKVLEEHGSDSSTYDGEPRASVSHDGKLVAWNSNSAGLTDVYLEKLVDPPQPIDSQMVYQDARGHGKMSVATFKGGLLEAFADAIMQEEGWYGPSALHPQGSRSWRNRNPGNIRSGHRMTTVDSAGYAQYKTLCDGYQDLLDDLNAKFTGRTTTGLGPDSTIQQFFEVYAPSADHNQPDSYARYVANFISLALGKPISSLSKLGDL